MCMHANATERESVLHNTHPHPYYSRAACDRVKENPPEQNICQLEYEAFCITYTDAHSHCTPLETYALLSVLLCLTRYKNTRIWVTNQIGHPSHLSHTPTLTVPVCVCDFKAALPHCQLLRDYNIGDNWTIADRCHNTHKHRLTHIYMTGQEKSTVCSQA